MKNYLLGEKMNYKIVTASEREDLIDAGDEIVLSVWPEFMLHDAVANRLFFQLYNQFPKFQYWLLEDDKIIGIGNSIPLFWDKPLEDLPEEGWDWALQKGFDDKKQNIQPNLLCALSITLNPKFQGKGYGGEMVKAMKQITEKHSLQKLILPVRPNQKKDYRQLSMADYITKCREDGLPIDAWLRVHTKLGAKIIKICPKSMLIQGSIKEWQEWTGNHFPISGKYWIDGALDEIEIDVKNNTGTYIEPNVWMAHEVNR
jgi:GNAT superfamily N-acetyltransferase